MPWFPAFAGMASLEFENSFRTHSSVDKQKFVAVKQNPARCRESVFLSIRSQQHAFFLSRLS